MKETTSREKILKRIRKAAPNIELNRLVRDVDREKPVFKTLQQPLTVHFAESFVAKGGRFIYCADKHDYHRQLKDLSNHLGWRNLNCRHPHISSYTEPSGVSTTEEWSEKSPVLLPAERLIARNGELLLLSSGGFMNATSGANNLLFLAFAHQLVSDLRQALRSMKAGPEEQLPSGLLIWSPAVYATKGAAGASETYLFYVDEKEAAIETKS